MLSPLIVSALMEIAKQGVLHCMFQWRSLLRWLTRSCTVQVHQLQQPLRRQLQQRTVHTHVVGGTKPCTKLLHVMLCLGLELCSCYLDLILCSCCAYAVTMMRTDCPSLCCVHLFLMLWLWCVRAVLLTRSCCALTVLMLCSDRPRAVLKYPHAAVMMCSRCANAEIVLC